MQNRAPILEFLRAADTPLADAAVAAAFDALAPDQMHCAVDLLLARARPSAQRVLIERYDSLPPDQQRRIQTAGSLMLAGVADVIRSGSSSARVNGLALLRAGMNPGLAHLAAGALVDRSAAVRRSAAETLRAMTDAFLARLDESRQTLGELAEPSATWQGLCSRLTARLLEERQWLVSAVRTALEEFTTHHQTDIVVAALLLVDDLGPVLFEHHTGQRNRFSHAVSEILTHTHDPRYAAAVYEGMTHPELQRPLVQHVASCRSDEFVAALIREQWRASVPVIRAALRQVHSLAFLDRGIAPMMALPESLHAAGISWLTRLGLPEALLLDLLRGTLDYDSEPALVAAAWAVASHRTPKAAALLRLLADSPCAPAARVARFLQTLRAPRACAEPPPGDPSSRWTRFLQQCRLEASFDSFWQHLDRIDPGGGVTAEDVTQNIPDFEQQLRARLGAASIADRLRAMELIAALKLEHLCRNDLFSFADDNDAALRAAVMSALGRIGDATSRRILERGVNDADPHVRVAAIDSLATLGPERSSALLRPRLADDAPPVRVAAIRALLTRRDPDAAVALIRTLSDELPANRLAALSLAAQLRLTALPPRLTHLAQYDPDAQVRQRAAKLLRAWDAEGLLPRNAPKSEHDGADAVATQPADAAPTPVAPAPPSDAEPTPGRDPASAEPRPNLQPA